MFRSWAYAHSIVTYVKNVSLQLDRVACDYGSIDLIMLSVVIATVKENVFKQRLNTSFKHDAILRFTGIRFQSRGAATEN